MGRIRGHKMTTGHMRATICIAVVVAICLSPTACTNRSENTQGSVCSATPTDGSKSVARVMTLLDGLDRDVLQDAKKRSQSGQAIASADYYPSLTAQVELWISTVDSPQVMYDIYVAGEATRLHHPRAQEHQDLIVVPDAFYEAQEAILSRLGALGTRESAIALLALVTNRDIGFDATRAMSLRCAIKDCGTSCLPYLREVRGERARLAAELIQMLERDEPCM